MLLQGYEIRMEDLLREQEEEERLRQRESQKQPVEFDQVRPLATATVFFFVFFFTFLLLRVFFVLLTCGSAEASSDLLKLTKGAEPVTLPEHCCIACNVNASN